LRVTAITIDSSENVGIGTSSPDTKLHIYKEEASPVLLTLHNHQPDIAGVGSHGNFIDFKMTDGNANFTPQARIGMNIKDSDGDGGLISEGAGNFVVYTGEGTDTSGNGVLTEQFRVSDKGHVTMPSQPAFSANNGSSTYLSVSNNAYTQVIPTSTKHNIGAHYSTSTGRFTAPVTGTYYMYASVAWQSTNAATHGRLTLGINSSTDYYQNCANIYQRMQGGTYQRMYVTHVMRLNANDYVQLGVIQDSGGTMNLRNCMNEFTGFLAG